MLTKHEKQSKRRLMAGSGAIAALLMGGLTLTASGTHAAETVRERVETATGVDLASIELPVLAQSEPLPPPPGPPLPPAAPKGTDIDRTVTTTTTDGKTKRLTRVIMRDKDGKVTEYTRNDDGKPGDGHSYMFRSKDGKPMTWTREGFPGMPPEALARLKTMPEISSRTCSDSEGNSGENVINRKDGDKRITIICTNRIEKLASLAALDGAKAGQRAWVIERNAEASALMGLRNARRSIEANGDMAEAQRSAALAGIDQAIREMEDKKD